MATIPAVLKNWMVKADPIKGAGQHEFSCLLVDNTLEKETPLTAMTNGVGYILYKPGRTRPTRLLLMSAPSERMKLGTQLWLGDGKRGIQGNLGRYIVVGCIDYTNGETVGTIPRLAVAVCMV